MLPQICFEESLDQVYEETSIFPNIHIPFVQQTLFVALAYYKMCK